MSRKMNSEVSQAIRPWNWQQS